MFDNRAADIKNTKLLQLEVKVKKRKNKCFMCLCSPLKKIKNEKSVTTNKRIHPKKIVSIVIYFSFIHSVYVVVTV